MALQKCARCYKYKPLSDFQSRTKPFKSCQSCRQYNQRKILTARNHNIQSSPPSFSPDILQPEPPSKRRRTDLNILDRNRPATVQDENEPPSSSPDILQYRHLQRHTQSIQPRAPVFRNDPPSSSPDVLQTGYIQNRAPSLPNHIRSQKTSTYPRGPVPPSLFPDPLLLPKRQPSLHLRIPHDRRQTRPTSPIILSSSPDPLIQHHYSERDRLQSEQDISETRRNHTHTVQDNTDTNPNIGLSPPLDRSFQEPMQARSESELANINLICSATPHDLGRMTFACSLCKALHWADERMNPNSRSSAIYTFHKCCTKGDGILQNLPILPASLQTLFTSDTDDARHFRRHIIDYNNALTFTSCRYQPDKRLYGTVGIQPFQIRGELYHLQGPLREVSGQLPCFAQIYFYDPLHATSIRTAQNEQLRPSLLQQLDQIVRDCNNPFIQFYKTAREVLESYEQNPDPLRIVLNPQMRLILEKGADRRRENLPTSTEVSIFLPDELHDAGVRDMVLTERNPNREEQRFIKINRSHPAYMPLHYVLIFPHGKPGWHWGLRLCNEDGLRQRDRLSQRTYFRYHLYSRAGIFSSVLNSARLLQQYVVDCYATLDQNFLDWYRHHQGKLRADVYNGVQDALSSDDADAAALGYRIILPASFIGSDRYMQQLFQNSMAVVRHFGKPTLFITFTANPHWPEIDDELGTCSLENRPDIVVRVFNQKRKALIKDLHTVFAESLGIVWTLEFQKRGLPHIHILLFLHSSVNSLDPAWINAFICAELPDPAWDQTGRLNQIVQQQLTHGPCGPLNPSAPCMVEDPKGLGGKICSKNFPKPYSPATNIHKDGYPEYRRRDDGRKWVKRVHGREVELDNRYIVPYNPFLTLKYDAHINVEVCASVQAIKYIHKYIHKGSDKITVQLENDNDEIARYLHGRYVGPQQAVWHLLEFPTHEQKPPVTPLQVHLPNEQPVYFPDDANPDQIQTILDKSGSTLTAFFQYNADHHESRTLLYQDFPAKYVFNKKTKVWEPRKRGFAIGRIYHCSPLAGERFYIRLLLTVRKGSTSFEDLRTVDSNLYATFKQACIALNLLDDDNEWVRCFEEAVQFSSGTSLRLLFTMALVHGDITDPIALWHQFRVHICDDLSYRLQTLSGPVPAISDPQYDYGLFLLQQNLEEFEKTLTDFQLPVPICNWNRTGGNSLIDQELNYNLLSEQTIADDHKHKLNNIQRQCFDRITTAIAETPTKAHFFVQGPAGTGKTFLYSTLCAHYRAQGEIVLCVASSGIAALLLPGGQTSHSRFKIPLNCTATATCYFKPTSQLAELFRQTRLIIWDEVPMQHKYNLTAVHFSLCDIMGTGTESDIFGGIPIVFGGDFAQTLPIVPRGNRAQQVDASLRNAFFWPQLTVLHLTQNMRIHAGPENERFSQWLARMSYEPALYGEIDLPTEISHQFSDEDTFCNHVYPPVQLATAHINPDFFVQRALLTLRNDIAQYWNLKMLEQMNGAAQTFYSFDITDIDTEQSYQYPVEFLQTLAPSGLPPSILHLKIGAPVILLRNLYPKQGLCNGTRLIITHLHPNCIEVSISGGQFHGQKRLLFRTKLSTKEGDYPFILQRTQFPIRLCFAMTINKAQGQSLQTVGVDLQQSCFSHGQLYVALSRVTNVARLFILFHKDRPRRTENIIYPEVLLRL